MLDQVFHSGAALSFAGWHKVNLSLFQRNLLGCAHREKENTLTACVHLSIGRVTTFFHFFLSNLMHLDYW
jgi:hypothetical protein